MLPFLSFLLQLPWSLLGLLRNSHKTLAHRFVLFFHMPSWCGREDSNLHGLLTHQVLSLACLPFHHFRVAPGAGFEPAIVGLTGRSSNQTELPRNRSFVHTMVAKVGVEPTRHKDTGS